MERAWIISVGTELTLGQTVDTNAAWLARRLAEMGIRAERHVTVDDALEPLRDLLRDGAGRADLLLVTGGLGPTDDDLTRQAVAAAAGVELELHPEIVEQIRAFFATRGREMGERNNVQALVPRGGRAIPNARGTAPGVFVEVEGTPCYALPGVPFEMREMFDTEIAPRLRAAARSGVLLSRVVHVVGPGESDIGEVICDLMQRGRNPEVGTTAQFGVIGIRINARGDTPEAAAGLLDATEQEVRGRFGQRIIGRDQDTLATVVGALLIETGSTVSTAESCTGGLIAKELTDVAGSSRYFLGSAVAYANEAKTNALGVPGDLIEREGAVSEPVARAMAEGARSVFASTYALSVTGIAGPGGGSIEKPVGLVYFALATPSGTTCRRVRFGSDPPRAVIRARAARAALDLLRRELLRASAGESP
jgi:nicotinamide-nucleotide amidase